MAKPMSETVDQGVAVVRELPVNLERLHETDHADWAFRNAEALKALNAGGLLERVGGGAVDWQHLIQELEHLSNEPEMAWKGHCKQTIRHMLKIVHWDSNPDLVFDVGHWFGEINDYRRLMRDALNEHKVMKGQVIDLLEECWREGCEMAADDLRLRALVSGKDELLERAAAVDKDRSGRCPWNIIEVAGYNTQTQDEKLGHDDRIWPGEVAERLNEVFKLGEGRRFNTSGWEKEPMRAADSKDEAQAWPGGTCAGGRAWAEHGQARAGTGEVGQGQGRPRARAGMTAGRSR